MSTICHSWLCFLFLAVCRRSWPLDLPISPSRTFIPIAWPSAPGTAPGTGRFLRPSTGSFVGVSKDVGRSVDLPRRPESLRTLVSVGISQHYGPWAESIGRAERRATRHAREKHTERARCEDAERFFWGGAGYGSVGRWLQHQPVQ